MTPTLYLDQNYLSAVRQAKTGGTDANSHGQRLTDELDRATRQSRQAMVRTIEQQLPERCVHGGRDQALASGFPPRAELFSGRRHDVLRLRDGVQSLIISPEPWPR